MRAPFDDLDSRPGKNTKRRILKGRISGISGDTQGCSIFGLFWFLGAALCPSKSGLMNKHIVKHIVV
jgi:hypothetical protein